MFGMRLALISLMMNNSCWVLILLEIPIEFKIL